MLNGGFIVTDLRKVIENLVREYINQLYNKDFLELAGNEEDSSSETKEEELKTLVIIPENAYEKSKLPEYLEELQKKSKVDYIYDLEGIGDYKRIAHNMKTLEKIDLFSPDIDLLEDLVKMKGSNNKSIKLILKALLYGIQVSIILPCNFEAQNLVQATYYELLQKAELLGCEVQNLESLSTKEEKSAFQSLLLEEDVVNALKNGAKEIMISAGCIITPLANDKIRDTNISIKRTRQE